MRPPLPDREPALPQDLRLRDPSNKQRYLFQILVTQLPQLLCQRRPQRICPLQAGKELRGADLKIRHDVEQLFHGGHRGPAGDGADIGTAFPQLQAQSVLRHPFLTS